MPDGGPAPSPVGEPARGSSREHGTDNTAAAVRLLRFLRDLTRARREPARDLSAYDHVHWLAELPGEVYVETDAGLGDVLFSVPVIPLSPPAVLEEFDGWLGLRQWYRALRDLAEGAAAQGHEVVLATGLLTWRPPEGHTVRDHLLTTPVRIVVDDRTERIDVVLAGPASLRDRELLTGLPGFQPARTEWVWDAVHAGQGLGLRASVSDVLRKWCAGAFISSEGVAVREDWAPGATGPVSTIPQLRLAPALVARPPGRDSVADYYDDLIAQLTTGGATVPDGLARLLDPAERPQLLHVEERTPQTVPDLLTGLLVRGRKVLVVSPDITPASLPPGIAGLCATGTNAATELRARAAAYDPSSHREQVAKLTEDEAAAERAVAELRERLRLTEATDPHDLGPGYRGGRAELDQRLQAEAADHAWFPRRPGLPERPPISAREAAELVRLLAEETPEREARMSQRDVDPGALPSAPYVRTLIEAEAAAAERARRTETELSRQLQRGDITLLARLNACAAAVNSALRDLGLDGHPGGWDPADHAVRAFSDALAHRRPAIWARVMEMTSQAEWAERALAAIGARHVELPSGNLHLRKLAAAAQELRNYLADGGTLKRGPLRSAPQRQAEPLLHAATVDGQAPTTPELLDIVFTHLMVRMACQELQYVWEAAGVSFPADVPPADRVARFARAHKRLARMRDVLPAIEETAGLLDSAGLGIQVTHPLEWYGYVVGLENAMLGLEVDRAAADLTALRDSIGAGNDEDPPELRAALAAIDARDADAYGRCLGALAEARHERVLQARCQTQLERVRAVHPPLADFLYATAGDAVWPDRVARWDEAWAWAYATTQLEELPPSSSETHLHTALAEAETRHHEITADLAAARAWDAYLAAPHDVPAWIVPLWQIPDLLPPRPNSFDVVIVDGEHGAGAEALFLLWLAPRLILVGPSGPALPVPEGTAPEPPLPDITPTAPLFELLTRFTAPEEEPEPLPERIEAPGPPPAPLPSVRQAEPPPSEPIHIETPEPAQIESEDTPERPVAAAQRGRSIVSYKRPELIEIVGRIAAREPDLADDQIIELARRLLGCPADEELLVGARLRYAIEAYREAHP